MRQIRALLKRVVIRPNPENGYLIELVVPTSGKERVAQRALSADLEAARKLADRYATMNGGCPVEDHTLN